MCSTNMNGELPGDLNDFHVAVTTFLLKRANEIWPNAYADCAPSYLTIPDLEHLIKDPVVLDTINCMPQAGDGQVIISQLKAFNRKRAEAIGAKVTSTKNQFPMFAVLFERPTEEKTTEDEFPF